MNETDGAQWAAFSALAKEHPHDNDVQMTLDLARWLRQELTQAQLPVPSILEEILRTVE